MFYKNYKRIVVSFTAFVFVVILCATLVLPGAAQANTHLGGPKPLSVYPSYKIKSPPTYAISGKDFREMTINRMVVEPKTINRPSARDNCWRLNPSNMVQPQPSQAPTPFFYSPFEAAWTGSIWSSTMDHGNPNYTKNSNMSSLGETLTEIWGAPGNYDSYYSPSLEVDLGYDGHDGNDFSVSGHALAVATGIVAKMVNKEQGKGWGNYIEIYYPEGYVTRYAHLDSFASGIIVGSEVQAGTILGTIGKTGLGTGVHLHFSVYRWNHIEEAWEITDPFGWDPWLSSGQQGSDPLFNCNGEISYNLWVGGWPQPVSGTPSTSELPQVKNVGGWYFPENDVILEDSATFIQDITLPDNFTFAPAETRVKTWRLKNNGSTTWGTGYNLAFVSGEQMGAPVSINVPSTSPNQTVDLSVSITAPASSGEHVGYFQLRNPQGTYFGSKIWVKINVNTPSSKITVLSADPASPSNTKSVRISTKVEGMQNLRAIRLSVDGIVQGEFGGPEYVFTWNTSGFTAGVHSVVIEAADQTDTSGATLTFAA